ncbi:DUF881 domain-containing protein [Dermacoccaceae bacterium W4C1]
MSRVPWKAVVPAVAAVAGVLFAVSASTAGSADLRSDGTGGLVSLVQQASNRVSGEQNRVGSLRTEVDTLSRSSGGARATALADQASKLAPRAGLTSVRGKALKITLTDSTRDVSSLPEGGTADWLVVHQQDVQGVVNALWEGGATSMMLMDQRVISTSAVRCVGNTLILQGRVYSPPFTVTAIGNISALRKALDDNPEVRNYRAYVDIAGLGYDATEVDSVMPAYAGPLTLRHARPVQ